MVNKDDLRGMIDAGVYSKGNEKLVLQVRDALILHFLLQGKNVIVDDTNLHPKHEEDIRLLVKSHNETHGDNVTVEVKVFDVSVEECIERDRTRGDASVGPDVILRMARQWCPDKYGDPVPELDMETMGSNGLPYRFPNRRLEHNTSTHRRMKCLYLMEREFSS
jgi:predicted kinase